MTPERFQHVRALFEAALAQAPERRAAWLAEATGDAGLRAEVGRLLAAEPRAAAVLADALPTVPQEPPAGPPAGGTAGQRVGPYELLRELGRGGMGTVWLARRADDVFRKQVALKLVHGAAGSPEARHRFQQEREVLAALDHPHIARVLDGGTTGGGVPYLVMEYVDGEPIDRWCDRRRLNVSERLALFGQVCAAVQHAHQHLVVHRDLKPSNILVSAEGGVKLLDFGIAKLLGAGEAGLTRTGQVPMTPAYASPEQVRGEAVTTATDVYALGVVLYELLTGREPYRLRSRLLHEMARVICEEEPSRPSTAVTEAGETPAGEAATAEQLSAVREGRPERLRRRLAGDLDTIVLKALRKEPARRYGSAESLREDLERHRQGLPVQARPHSAAYRAGKLVRRHPSVAGAVVLLGVLAVSGAVTVHWQAIWFGVMFLVCLAVGYAYRKREWGGRLVARKSVPPHAVFLLVCFSVVLLFIGWVPLAHQEQVMTAVGVTLLLQFSYLLLRWPWRARWAGPLLLDLSRRPGKGQRLISGVMALSVAAGLVAVSRDDKPITAYQIVSSASMALFGAFQYLLTSRLELRQRGVLMIGHLVPWHRLESHRWEPGESGWMVLQVRVRHWFGVSLPGQWIVAAERREEVEAVLQSALGGTVPPARVTTEWLRSRTSAVKAALLLAAGLLALLLVQAFPYVPSLLDDQRRRTLLERDAGHGGVSDPAGDARRDSRTPNAPDLVAVSAVAEGGHLTVIVKFAPGTFDPALSRVHLSLDVDENPSTGHPGTTSGGKVDAAVLGVDYGLDLDAASNPQGAQVTRYAGTKNAFTIVGFAPLRIGVDQISARVPLALLGNDDGRMGFKASASAHFPNQPPTSSTVILDTAPDAGLLAGRSAVQGIELRGTAR